MITCTELYTGIGGGQQEPKMLVIHTIAERIRIITPFEYKGKTIKEGVYGAHTWLQMMGLSCHFLLYPDGSFVKQRSTKQICWHAKGFNNGSIGIEVLVEGTHTYESFLQRIKQDYVTQAQYNSLIEMSNGIIDYFSIEKVVRHSDISPGRKHDPGDGFKWEWFKQQLNESHHTT